MKQQNSSAHRRMLERFGSRRSVPNAVDCHSPEVRLICRRVNRSEQTRRPEFQSTPKLSRLRLQRSKHPTWAKNSRPVILYDWMRCAIHLWTSQSHRHCSYRSLVCVARVCRSRPFVLSTRKAATAWRFHQPSESRSCLCRSSLLRHSCRPSSRRRSSGRQETIRNFPLRSCRQSAVQPHHHSCWEDKAGSCCPCDLTWRRSSFHRATISDSLTTSRHTWVARGVWCRASSSRFAWRTRFCLRSSLLRWRCRPLSFRPATLAARRQLWVSSATRDPTSAQTRPVQKRQEWAELWLGISLGSPGIGISSAGGRVLLVTRHKVNVYPDEASV